MKKMLVLLASALLASAALAQSDTAADGEYVRKGWSLGVLPCLSYDSDYGFQFGVLGNVYYFGDGSTYPDYLHNTYFEASSTSKHSDCFRVSYDSKALVPNHRLSVDLSYLTDAMCDFYGFDGYASTYNPLRADVSSSDYKTRAFYKYHRDMLRFSADLQGTIAKPWHWNVGAGLQYFKVGSVDVERMNRYGSAADNPLPAGVNTLLDNYVRLGYISVDEARGGLTPYLHGGLSYDTRNREQNPQKGVYADAFLTYNLGVGGLRDFSSLQFNAAWRHYITLVPKYLTFAYRLGTQLNLAGRTPFYQNSIMNQTFFMSNVVFDGVGGGSNVRGLLRSRVLAPGVAYANFEFRWQIAQFKIKKEMFYLGLNPFMDAGMVVQPYGNVISAASDQAVSQILSGAEASPMMQYADVYRPHLTSGLGLKIAMNDNFILSIDWAAALDRQDNDGLFNLYVKMSYLF